MPRGVYSLSAAQFCQGGVSLERPSPVLAKHLVDQHDRLPDILVRDAVVDDLAVAPCAHQGRRAAGAPVAGTRQAGGMRECSPDLSPSARLRIGGKAAQASFRGIAPSRSGSPDARSASFSLYRGSLHTVQGVPCRHRRGSCISLRSCSSKPLIQNRSSHICYYIYECDNQGSKYPRSGKH